MSLNNKIHLLYIKTEDLWQWIKENNLSTDSFALQKERWEKETNKQPNFFSDTELLLMYQDNLLLRITNDSHASFLAKTYQLKYQAICQKLFQENKNIILISTQQWKEPKDDKEMMVLFKDRENIEKSLGNWLKEATI